MFGRIIGKSRDHYINKENGFNQIFKLHKQRLFSTLYPSLIENMNKMSDSEGEESRTYTVEIIMHTCSLVSLSSLYDKLSELIPVAE